MLTAAGMTKEAEDKVISEQVDCATAEEKTCSEPWPLCPR